MLLLFAELGGTYVEACRQLAPLLDGRSVDNPVGGPRVTFAFATLEKKARDLVAASASGGLV